MEAREKVIVARSIELIYPDIIQKSQSNLQSKDNYYVGLRSAS